MRRPTGQGKELMISTSQIVASRTSEAKSVVTNEATRVIRVPMAWFLHRAPRVAGRSLERLFPLRSR